MPASKLAVVVCPHCGNHTIFDVLTEQTAGIEHEDQYDISEEIGEPGPIWETIPFTEFLTWRILQCKVCSKLVLQEKMENAENWVTLYPPPKAPLHNVPQTVRNAFVQAVKLQHVEPNSCAMWLGRALEALCKHEKAEGRNLAAKLAHLATLGRIPPLLADMGTTIRQFRNLGAHDAEDEVRVSDVPILFDFVDAILEYLYIAPAQIASIRARLVQSSASDALAE